MDQKSGILILTLTVFVLANFCSVVSAVVTIVSSPQLGVDTVCDNQTVTLTCHTDQTTGNMITWYWYNQSRYGDTLKVVATMTGVVYSCIIFNDGRNIGTASITLKANGTPPRVDKVNFAHFIQIHEGIDLNLTTVIYTDIPLSSGYPKWIRDIRRPMPSDIVKNYTTDEGEQRSTLFLHDLKSRTDSGNYSITVKNRCGFSTEFGVINILQVICPPLNHSVNGTANCLLGYDGTPSYEDTCNFMCNTGYELTGSKIRTCQNDGSWSGRETKCKGVEETGKNHGRTDKLHNVTIGCATGTVVVLAVMIALTAIICLIRRRNKRYSCRYTQLNCTEAIDNPNLVEHYDQSLHVMD